MGRTRLRLIFLVAAVHVLVLASQSFATIWTVDDDYVELPGANFSDIQSALFSANEGDTVLVYPGTYTSTGTEVVKIEGESISLIAAGDRSTTIIHGQGVRRCVLINGDETNDTIISGFTITDGQDDFGGGGIACIGSSPTISDCVVSFNKADGNQGRGGGIYSIFGANPTVEDCDIMGNGATRAGGGVFCDYTGHAVLHNTVLRNNAASFGGGAYWGENGSMALLSCILKNNVANWNGGGICGEGLSGTIHACLVKENWAVNFGGGISLVGEGDSEVSMTRVTGNETLGDGGGMHLWGGSATIDGCEFWENSCGGDGVAIRVDFFAAPNITHCDIRENQEYTESSCCNIVCSYNSGAGPVVDHCMSCGPFAGINGPWVDGGANSFVGSACPERCLDLDRSYQVDHGDLQLLIEGWGLIGGVVDLDEDESIGIGDLLMLLEAWGDCVN